MNRRSLFKLFAGAAAVPAVAALPKKRDLILGGWRGKFVRREGYDWRPAHVTIRLGDKITWGGVDHVVTHLVSSS